MSKKKKNKGNAKKKGERQARPMPDRRALERPLQELSKLLSEYQFQSVDEINEFLNELHTSEQGLPAAKPATPPEKAQDVMYDAFEAHGRRRVKLARKALKISEECTDAYVLLAEEAARSAEEALELYEKGVSAAERTLGPEKMSEYAGHFWGVTETRPYMRARAGVAHALWALDRREEAIEHLQALLRLNPNDNQGLRYFLAHALLATERYDQLRRLLRKYEEPTAYWSYTSALLEFRQKGETANTDGLLRQAIELNRHVPAYLLGAKRLPRQLPDYVGFGDETEAMDYVDGNADLWAATPGALRWLSQLATEENASYGGREPDWEDMELDEELLAQLFAGPELAYAPFELDEWLQAMEIPRKEYAAVRECLRRGVGIHSEIYYGRNRYKRQSQEIIDEQLEDPYVFGYAALEMLKKDRIGDETKEKVVNYALLIMQPSMHNGVPHGLLEMLGFLAQREQLSLLQLLLGLLALYVNSVVSFGPTYWTDGVTSPSMAALGAWMAAEQELELDEKLWLVWKISLQCDAAAHLGKAFANAWLEHPQVPDQTKLELCQSWLEKNREVGTPHYIWRLMLALIAGDTDEVARIKEEHGEELDDFPLFEGDETPLLPEEELDFTTSFFERRQRLASPYLKRLAIPWLVRLGEDLHVVVERYWGYGSDYDETHFKLGVRDAIAEFHEQLEPHELQRLIERGIDDGKVQVRKPFYLLSIDFYEDSYLEQALDDNAASLRRWAAKKLGL